MSNDDSYDMSLEQLLRILYNQGFFTLNAYIFFFTDIAYQCEIE